MDYESSADPTFQDNQFKLEFSCSLALLVTSIVVNSGLW